MNPELLGCIRVTLGLLLLTMGFYIIVSGGQKMKKKSKFDKLENIGLGGGLFVISTIIVIILVKIIKWFSYNAENILITLIFIFLALLFVAILEFIGAYVKKIIKEIKCQKL